MKGFSLPGCQSFYPPSLNFGSLDTGFSEKWHSPLTLPFGVRQDGGKPSSGECL